MVVLLKIVAIIGIAAVAALLTLVLISSSTTNSKTAQTTSQVSSPPIVQASNSFNQTAMLDRGNTAMGFDQNKIMHHFMATPTGGLIMVVTLNNSDTQTIQRIQSHIGDIQQEFSQGNFTKPFYIHDQNVPGTDVMTQKKDLIKYSVQNLDNGATLALTTNDTELLQAIQQFMSFQGMQHHGH